MEWGILLVLLIIIFLASLIHLNQRPASRKLNLPPGPRQIPILGSLYALKQPLYRQFHQLSEKYGPIFHLRLGAIPIVVVSSAKLAKEVLKTGDSEFASRPDTAILRQLTLDHNTIGLSPLSSKLMKLRRITLTNLFPQAKLELGAAQRHHQVQLLVKQVLDSLTHVNLTSLFHDVTSRSIFHMLMGRLLTKEALESDSLFLQKLLQVMNDEAFKMNIGDMFPWLATFDFRSRGVERRLRNHLIPQLKSFYSKIINDHRIEAPGESDTHDFVDVLLSLKEDQAFEDIQITGTLSSLIVAGISTSEGTMDYAMAELLQHPKVLIKVQEEIDSVVGKERLLEEVHIPKLPYLNAVVKETLRLHNPVPLGLPHCNPKPAKLGGYDIPANSIVFINHWAMGRNEFVWENPHQFHPERFLDNSVAVEDCQFAPFGAGKRKCLGQGYAMRLIPLVIGTLVQAFDWEGIEVDMNETAGIGLGRTKNLVGQAYPRR